jgi:hypothetical protein
MFRALLAHLQETLYERRFGDLCAVVDVGRLSNQPTSTTAHNSHQIYVRVVFLEDGQIIPETCRDFEP